MTPYEFAEKLEVPEQLRPLVAERLRLADFEAVRPEDEPVARRIVAQALQAAHQRDRQLLAAVAPNIMRTAAGGRGGAPAPRADVARPCPRCGAAMRAITLANKRAAVYCLADKVTMPV